MVKLVKNRNSEEFQILVTASGMVEAMQEVQWATRELSQVTPTHQTPSETYRSALVTVTLTGKDGDK